MKAGLVFGNRCPCPEGTDEARQWALGWPKGVLKRTRANGGYRVEEVRGLWRRLVQCFLGN